MEKITLTAPDQARPGTPEYEPIAILINKKYAFIEVYLEGVNGEMRTERLENALPMIKAINTGNHSTKSMMRKLMEKLLADGKLSGAIAGTPD